MKSLSLFYTFEKDFIDTGLIDIKDFDTFTSRLSFEVSYFRSKLIRDKRLVIPSRDVFLEGEYNDEEEVSRVYRTFKHSDDTYTSAERVLLSDKELDKLLTQLAYEKFIRDLQEKPMIDYVYGEKGRGTSNKL